MPPEFSDGINFFLVIGLAYETSAAGTAFFGTTYAYRVFRTFAAVFVVTTVAYFTINFLIKFVVHSFKYSFSTILACRQSYYAQSKKLLF